MCNTEKWLLIGEHCFGLFDDYPRSGIENLAKRNDLRCICGGKYDLLDLIWQEFTPTDLFILCIDDLRAMVPNILYRFSAEQIKDRERRKLKSSKEGNCESPD